MRRTLTIRWIFPVLCLLAGGCIGRPVMQGSSPYGTPQYVTIPNSGPIAAPPGMSPTPISSPQPSPPPGPVASPPNSLPGGGDGISLQPASRVSAVMPPLYQTWRTPSTFAPTTFAPTAFAPATYPHAAAVPPGARYAGLARTIDGRVIPWNVAGSTPTQSGSGIDRNYVRRAGDASASQLVVDLPPTPGDDLKHRGGKTIRDLTYVNIFIGGPAAWNDSERKNIDWALNAAMTDPHLNHVLMQYFEDQPVTASYRGSFLLNGYNPTRVTQTNLRELVKLLHSRGSFSQLPLESTAVNFFLPKGTVLEDPDSGGQRASASDGVIPLTDSSSSLQGLGGYHGSVRVGSQSIYYSAGVYSEVLPNGQTNGVPVFRVPWKDTVATFYHQLQEIRTDPDVDDAIVSGQERYVGWVSDTGEEIGDLPVLADSKDGRIDQVFAEVPLANGSGFVPIQLCYSNAVHGPEGPIPAPHRGSPLPTPPATTPPWGSQPVPQPQPEPQPQQPTPPPSGGQIDPDLEWLRSEWEHLPQSLRLQILNLIKDDHAHSDERSFGQ